jgi:hypothetical protein
VHCATPHLSHVWGHTKESAFILFVIIIIEKMSVFLKAEKAPQKRDDINPDDNDDWESDPNYVNDVDEKKSRWGSKELKSKEEVELTREELAQLREKSKQQHHEATMNEYLKDRDTRNKKVQ